MSGSPSAQDDGVDDTKAQQSGDPAATAADPTTGTVFVRDGRCAIGFQWFGQQVEFISDHPLIAALEQAFATCGDFAGIATEFARYVDEHRTDD